MDIKRGPKIVVIGGGTGSFTLLTGLKHYAQDITAIVNMADDGGSTGQLRDELGVLPPGDVRQCLVALSDSPRVRDLFNYRFEEGVLEGHAFGNLFLTALQKMTGSFAEAIDVADEVLNVRGRVVPVTLEDVHLIMRQRNGSDIMGEYTIGSMAFSVGEERPDLELSPKATLNPDAKKAILAADIIVIAPGSLYGSLAPALLVDGMGKALKHTKAKIVYVCNLVTKPGQTDNFMVHDFADEIERFVGEQILDYVIYNTSRPNSILLERYNKDREYGVRFNESALKSKHYKAIGVNLIASTVPKIQKADKISHSRSYIRHNPDTIARNIMKLFFS